MRPILRPSLLAAALAGLALASSAAAETPIGVTLPPMEAESGRPELGLMGTIPLYWGESAGIGELLGGEGEAHWARAPLEERFVLRPLAALTEENLAGLRYLLLAQPRGLSPAENVALDAWVRSGGHLLLFADPMLTGESRFGIGDRRRPQDVILLSPILRRWGLDLQFDADQPPGAEMREIAGAPLPVGLPVNLPGQFAPPVQEACTLDADGVLADCAIGQGRAVVLADAALLDLHHPAAGSSLALAALVERAFGSMREIAERRGREGSGEAEAPVADVKEPVQTRS